MDENMDHEEDEGMLSLMMIDSVLFDDDIHHKHPERVYSAKQIADVCCNQLIPGIVEDEYGQKLKENIHSIRSFFIEHDLHSFKLGTMGPIDFSDRLEDHTSNKIERDDGWKLFRSLSERVPFVALNWSNIAQCVHHEMYPMMASNMKSVIETMDDISLCDNYGRLDEESMNKMIETLKSKRNVTNDEIEYIRKLAERATSDPPNLYQC